MGWKVLRVSAVHFAAFALSPAVVWLVDRQVAPRLGNVATSFLMLGINTLCFLFLFDYSGPSSIEVWQYVVAIITIIAATQATLSQKIVLFRRTLSREGTVKYPALVAYSSAISGVFRIVVVSWGGGREGGGEGGRGGGREGGREGGKEGRREGGREGGREGERKGEREREEEVEGVRQKTHTPQPLWVVYSCFSFDVEGKNVFDLTGCPQASISASFVIFIFVVVALVLGRAWVWTKGELPGRGS